MNCLYFVFWAQNQLRSGNNTLCQCQPYSSNHLLCCQDNAPLYATWRLNSVIVGTSANSAHGLVTQGFSGHIIRDSWCHGHIRCLAPHAMAIENPPGQGFTAEPLFSVCRAPRRTEMTSAWDLKGPDPEKAGCVPGRDSFHREKIYGLLSARVWLRPEKQ